MDCATWPDATRNTITADSADGLSMEIAESSGNRDQRKKDGDAGHDCGNSTGPTLHLKKTYGDNNGGHRED